MMARRLVIVLAFVVAGAIAGTLAGRSRSTTGEAEKGASSLPRAREAGPRNEARPARVAPPAFRTPVRELVTTPGAPGYDPFTLGKVVPLTKIFASEPRHPQWAAAVEPWLSSTLHDDLKMAVTDLSPIEVECRTTVCRARFPPGTREIEAMRAIQQWLIPGSRAAFGDNTLLLLLHGGPVTFKNVAVGDGVATIDRMKSLRSQRLQMAREGHAPGELYAVVPKEKWPIE